MANEPKLQNLLYVSEHTTCSRYLVNIGVGFIYKELEAGTEFGANRPSAHQLLIFLEGRCTIDYGEFKNRTFSAGQMVLTHRLANYKGRVNEKVKLLVMSFENLMGECDKLVLESYNIFRDSIQYDFQPTPIHHPLDIFCSQLIYLLENGINCVHLHEIKHKELFLCLRWFYTKEEIAYLLYELIGGSLDFRQFIYDNCHKNSTITDLSALANMSKSAFSRRFKTEFGEPAHQWLLKHRREQVVQMILQSRVSVADLSEAFGYASNESFHHFCKKAFSCTPKQLIDRYKDIKKPRMAEVKPA